MHNECIKDIFSSIPIVCDKIPQNFKIKVFKVCDKLQNFKIKYSKVCDKPQNLLRFVPKVSKCPHNIHTLVEMSSIRAYI